MATEAESAHAKPTRAKRIEAEPTKPGAIDTPQEAEARRQSYDASKFERPSVTVDVVILTVRAGRLEVLLVKRRHWPFEGMWAIPGGFVEPNESLEDSARRELHEETGVSDVYLEQLRKQIYGSDSCGWQSFCGYAE